MQGAIKTVTRIIEELDSNRYDFDWNRRIVSQYDKLGNITSSSEYLDTMLIQRSEYKYRGRKNKKHKISCSIYNNGNEPYYTRYYYYNEGMFNNSIVARNVDSSFYIKLCYTQGKDGHRQETLEFNSADSLIKKTNIKWDRNNIENLWVYDKNDSLIEQVNNFFNDQFDDHWFIYESDFKYPDGKSFHYTYEVLKFDSNNNWTISESYLHKNGSVKKTTIVKRLIEYY